MTFWIRLLCGAVAVTGSVVGVAYTQSGSTDQFLADIRATLNFRRDSAQEQQRSALISHRQEIVTRRLKAKHTLIWQLIDGEMNLWQTAAWFKYLNENPADCRDPYEIAFQGASDEEKVCRQVIAWVNSEARGALPSSRAQTEATRLEKELADHLAAHGGKVVLPAVRE
jgi:hypothetical protein